MKDQIKKAVESAEQEIQEREISHLKNIIKDLLEKKSEKEKEKRAIEAEISVIKQTIDDFKAGRLDKVKELQEKDPLAYHLLPFKIVIVNQPVISQPWYWTYSIQPTATTSCTTTTTSTASLTNYGNTTVTQYSCSAGATGNSIATFTSGTYALGDGRIINL